MKGGERHFSEKISTKLVNIILYMQYFIVSFP